MRGPGCLGSPPISRASSTAGSAVAKTRCSALGRERPAESEEGALARDDAGATSENLRAALGELVPEERDLLLLFACVGLSYDEIAEALSLPLGTVRSRIHRLRHKLRERLSPPAQEVRA
jgi:RNA polymerase sigma factor (sigma-70 family)